MKSLLKQAENGCGKDWRTSRMTFEEWYGSLLPFYWMPLPEIPK
jgi:hypothetical protein